MYGFVSGLVSLIFNIIVFSMLGRAVIDLFRSFNPAIKPTGLVLIVVEIGYTVSDWVMWPARKVFRPLRLGPVFIDVAWTITMVLVVIVRSFVESLVFALFNFVG